jgi:DNA-binding winged helix-turn-helix (wHTH) protein
VTVRFGAFTLDSEQRQLRRDGEIIHLTPKAFDLLVLLVTDAPRVVRKTELHERLWPGTFVSDATLVSLVKELRRALADREAATPIIRTAHGVGYAFAAPIDRLPARVAKISCWIVSGGRRIALSEGDNIIGRDPASAVSLDVAGVSRRHARIVVGEHAAVLEDLGSKNGTSLDGEPVTQKVTLHDSNRIQVGPILIIYHASATGMSTETVVDSVSSSLRTRRPRR